MKKNLFLVLLLCISLASAHAQVEDYRNGISFKLLWMDYESPQMQWLNGDFADRTTFTRGAEISYHRWLHKSLNLQLPLSLGTVRLPDQRNDAGWLSLDAVLQLKLLDNTHLINPYLVGGVGMTMLRWEDLEPHVPLGAGLNIRLFPNVFANAQASYRIALNDRPDVMQYAAGLNFAFGRGPQAPKIVDTDGDGIPDDEDECPFEAGLPEFGGCPDTDGDGIPDHLDACPQEAGPASAQGCPDRDGDGIPDKDDRCPDVPGLAAFGGCPDSDGDGIPDDEDDCPNEPGPLATRGCPDRDGDGVPDKDDRCPDEPGPATLQGCPDRDNDGVADIDDRCPDQPGPASNFGCPELKEEEKAIISMAIQNINFLSNSATLTQASLPVLDQLADILRNNPAYSCDISGHTDATGAPEHNQELSERRARACFDYLVGKGIDPSRLTHAGFGQTKPLTENRTPEGRAKNRRVEFDVRIK